MSCIQSAFFSDKVERIAHHTHMNVHQVFFLISGNINVTVGKKTYCIDSPSVIFINNLESHSITAKGQTYARYCINLDPKSVGHILKNDRLMSVITNRPKDFKHYIELDEIFPLVHEILKEIVEEFNSEDIAVAENADRLFGCLMMAICRYAPKAFPCDEAGMNSTISKIKKEIETNLDANISLEALAAKYHISSYYLAHSYKKITGYSIKNHQMLIRIAESKELLTNTNMQITEICEKIGFPDVSNFSKYFKKKTGYTPSKYRQKHISGEEK